MDDSEYELAYDDKMKIESMKGRTTPRQMKAHFQQLRETLGGEL